MRVSKVIDKIFLRIVLFLIVFIIVGFYTSNNFSAVASGVISVVIIELLGKIFSKHPNKRQIKKADLNENKGLQNQLILNSKKENLEIFLKAFSGFDKAAINQETIEFSRDGKNYVAFLNFSYAHLTKQDALEFYKKAKDLNKECCLIFTTMTSADVYGILAGFKDVNIKVLADLEVYYFLKKAESLPKIEKLPKAKPDFSKILKRAFSRKNFKGYFMCAIILFLFSFITPFKFYYRICTIALLFFSLICLIRKQPA